MERFVVLKIREDLFIIWDKQDKKVVDCTENSTLADETIRTLKNQYCKK